MILDDSPLLLLDELKFHPSYSLLYSTRVSITFATVAAWDLPGTIPHSDSRTHPEIDGSPLTPSIPWISSCINKEIPIVFTPPNFDMKKIDGVRGER